MVDAEDREGAEEFLLDPSETGIEVLLNRPGIVFNRKPLEELASEGYASKGGFEEFGAFPPDMEEHATYFLRSHYSDDLGLVLQKVNHTQFMIDHGVDHPLEGLSISLVIPGDPVAVEGMWGSYMVKPEKEIDPYEIDWPQGKIGKDTLYPRRSPSHVNGTQVMRIDLLTLNISLVKKRRQVFPIRNQSRIFLCSFKT